MADARPKNPFREIVQPFVDLVHAPRALWGVNLPYLIEGFCYFGMVQYLGMYFQQYTHLDDLWSQRSKGIMTAGITIAMFFIGGRVDKWGVRLSLLGAFALMIVGRSVLAAAPGAAGGNAFSTTVYSIAVAGILFVVLGYGLYQPAAYAAVRQFTNEKSATMGYAMLYALMNLGGWMPSFMTPVRENYGIRGAYWVYTVFTGVSLVLTYLLLTRKTVERARSSASETEKGGGETSAKAAAANGGASKPAVSTVPNDAVSAGRGRVLTWLRNHPLADPKFAFFIFALIPVQTLFAFNFGTYQAYVDRAYTAPAVLAAAGIEAPAAPPTTQPASSEEARRITYDELPVEVRLKLSASQRLTIWAGEHFEAATSLNSLLIFVLVPIVAAVTSKRKVYNMMIVGTLVMAAPTFLLAIGPSFGTLGIFVLLMTVGEAIWQPRFLQYAAEIAPPGRTGAYMGVAQFPWFLTKMIVPLYEGWFLQRYCPATGPQDTRTMWLIYACIAMASTVLLIGARNWLGRDFKTKSA